VIHKARCALFLTLLLSSLSMSAAAPARAARWSPVGPDGGTVSVLAVAPSALRTVYAATQKGLVFRSTDAGASWSLAGPGLPSGFVSSLLVDRRDASTLYAGLNGLYGKGVFRSVDGGATWSSLKLPFNVWSLAQDPRDPEVLLAGTGIGLFRSADGGASWSPIELGSGQWDVLVVIFDPVIPGKAWAGQAVNGIFVSVDSGVSWTPRSELPGGASPISLAVDPSSGALLAGTSLASRGRPLFRSTDDGATWAATSVRETTVFDIAASSGPTPTLYAATETAVFRSADGGVTWTSSGRLGRGPTCLAVPPPPASFVYAGTYASGVFKSTDRGTSWRHASRGLNGAEIDAFAIAPSNPSVLYARVRDWDVFRSTDGGRTWRAAGRGIGLSLILPILRVHPRDPRIAYLAADHGEIWKTTNGGTSWQSLSEGEEMGCMLTADFQIDPVDPDNLFVSGLNESTCVNNHEEGCLAFRSTDAGESWTCSLEDGGHTLAIDPKRPASLFAGNFQQILRSTDAGKTWNDLAAAFLQESGRLLSTLFAAPRSPETVYAATTSGIFQSIDGGTNWQPRNSGLPAQPNIYELAGSPSTARVLYAAIQQYQPATGKYSGSLYRTTDGSSSWRQVAQGGLPRSLLVQMEVHPSRPDVLLVAPERGGLYRLTP
jgi:photosystem II stability/assembly factor-like uncharacterized protein